MTAPAEPTVPADAPPSADDGLRPVLTPWAYLDVRLIGIPLLLIAAACGSWWFGDGGGVRWISVMIIGLLTGYSVLEASTWFVRWWTLALAAAFGVAIGASGADGSRWLLVAALVVPWLAPYALAKLFGRGSPPTT